MFCPAGSMPGCGNGKSKHQRRQCNQGGYIYSKKNHWKSLCPSQVAHSSCSLISFMKKTGMLALSVLDLIRLKLYETLAVVGKELPPAVI